MNFRQKVRRCAEAGIKTFEVLDYFFVFCSMVGRSVRDIHPDDIPKYYRDNRFFQVLSIGNSREAGAGLLDAVYTGGKYTEAYQENEYAGKSSRAREIVITEKGRKLLSDLDIEVNDGLIVDTTGDDIDFRAKIRTCVRMGIRTFEVLDYFFVYCAMEGRTVKDLHPHDLTAYQRDNRFFQVLSRGSSREEGANLLRGVPQKTRKDLGYVATGGSGNRSRVIEITEKGHELLSVLGIEYRSKNRIGLTTA